MTPTCVLLNPGNFLEICSSESVFNMRIDDYATRESGLMLAFVSFGRTVTAVAVAVISVVLIYVCLSASPSIFLPLVFSYSFFCPSFLFLLFVVV